MQINDFTIRAYGFQELALLYFPNSTPKSASAQLKKWISHPMLMDQLVPTGYHSGQKIFTPRQVAIIVGHLGEP